MSAAMVDFVCGGCRKKVGCCASVSDMRAGNVTCPRCGRRISRAAGEEMAKAIEAARKPIAEMTPKEIGLSPGQVKAAESQKMLFGKYAGRTLGEIVREDPRYLDWLNGVDLRNPALRTAVAVVCDVHAGEIERAIDDGER